MCEVLTWPSVQVALGARGYQIAIVSHLLERLPEYIEDWMARSQLPKGPRNALVVSDRNIVNTHATATPPATTAPEIVCHRHAHASPMNKPIAGR